jgi:hypothetical protein
LVESGADDQRDLVEDGIDEEPGFIDEDLKRWIAEKHAENKEFVVYLYKFDNPNAGRIKSLIDQDRKSVV